MGIEIVFWKNDPTPECRKPENQHALRRQAKVMQQYGCAFLLVQDWARISPDLTLRNRLLDEFMEYGVLVMSSDESTNHARYEAYLRNKTLDEVKERSAIKIKPMIKSRGETSAPFGYRSDKHGGRVKDEDLIRLLTRVRTLRREGYSVSQMTMLLPKEGFVSPNGKPWSHGKIGMIARQVLPVGPGHRHMLRKYAQPQLPDPA